MWSVLMNELLHWNYLWTCILGFFHSFVPLPTFRIWHTWKLAKLCNNYIFCKKESVFPCISLFLLCFINFPTPSYNFISHKISPLPLATLTTTLIPLHNFLVCLVKVQVCTRVFFNRKTTTMRFFRRVFFT